MALPPFFVKPLPFTIAAVSSQGPANLAAHLAEFQYPGMTYRSNGPTSANIDVDLGSAQTVDCVALLGTNAVLGATAWYVSMGPTLASIQTGPQGFITDTVQFVSPAVVRPVYHAQFEFDVPQTYRFLRVALGNVSANFEAQFLVIGKKIGVSRYYEPQWENGSLDRSSIAIGRNGVPDIAYGRVDRSRSFTLSWLTEDEFEFSIMPLMMACGKTEPVFCSFDPAATIYRQGRTDFGRLNEARIKKRAFNAFEREFEIESMIY